MHLHAPRLGRHRTVTLLAVAAVAAFGCGSQQAQEAGQYRIVTVKNAWFGAGCQPRTEFYHVDPQSPDAAPTYLGTCGTPQFVSESMGMPSDPSCFAIAQDGAALVYFHRPNWCGAGEAAASKPGGVYRHALADGDRMLYSDQEHVSQVWTRQPIEPDAIRVSWKNARPSRSGATCSQQLLIRADGTEMPDGEPRTVHGCLAGRDDARAGAN